MRQQVPKAAPAHKSTSIGPAALLAYLYREYSRFEEAENKREYVIARLEGAFDEWVEPVDIPGPDAVIDPFLRAAIRPLVTRIWEVVVARL